jgi:3'-5' exoribonuclease
MAQPHDHPTLEAPTKAFVRDLSDGEAVDSVFLVRDRARRFKRNGDPFLKLELADVTGSCDAVLWEAVDDSLSACEVGSVVRVAGSFSVDSRYGATLTVRSLRAAADGEYDAADLHAAPSMPVDQMVADLRALIETVQSAPLRGLLHRLFAEGSDTWARWREAPAAKHYHQAYRHGLLEHCLTVAQAVSAVSATFPGIDRDVAVTGAILHDIGKIEAYALAGDGIELTDAGRLEGEIPLGYHMVRRELERIPHFPPDVAQAVLHIILSHHGALEHGSPVVPCTREATLVHMMDNLGGKLGSFDRIERTLADGEHWSSFDRAISAAAYFAPSAGPRAA